ncbi:MAG: hypothetical protein Q8N47_10165 [Bryobacterales bacterium]|nr:hypothetical protein [Bryobacterales bacterium]
MIAYVFGAGASAHAGYPLASKLLMELSNWLEVQNIEDIHIRNFRNRLVQLRALFPSLDDFEGILSSLGTYGHDRVNIESGAPQAQRDIFEDIVRGDVNAESKGFYPQYLRDDLVSAVREFFYHLESDRSGSKAYDDFAHHRASADDTLITFNYDVALERALKRAARWDIGSGYGFPLFAERPGSQATVFKLHGSVNWFQLAIQNAPPPLVFPRDLELLGYEDLRDTRIGANGCAVNHTGTLIPPDTDKRFDWEPL